MCLCPTDEKHLSMLSKDGITEYGIKLLNQIKAEKIQSSNFNLVCMHCGKDIEDILDDDHAVSSFNDHLMQCNEIPLPLRQVNIV